MKITKTFAAAAALGTFLTAASAFAAAPVNKAHQAQTTDTTAAPAAMTRKHSTHHSKKHAKMTGKKHAKMTKTAAKS